MIIEEQIILQASLYPEKKAIISGHESVTYSELMSRILSARDCYLRWNFASGASILMAAGKQIGFAPTYFGAHLAGLKVIPVDADIKPARLQYIREILHPIAAIGFGSEVEGMPCYTFDEIKTDETVCDEIVFPNVEDVADYMFTTGTTGTPKCVPLTFANELAAVQHINQFIQNSVEDVELLALPVSHSFGLGRLRCCLFQGQTLILLGSFVNVKRLFRLMEEYKVGGFSMVPASWRFLQKMSGDKLGVYKTQLKYIEIGSAYLSKAEKQYLADMLPNTRVCMHYGLTEASRSAFMEFHDDNLYLDSVGKASAGTDIKVVDEDGNVLPEGIEGEICVTGAHVMNGYVNAPIDNSFFGTYFRTGDCGLKNQEGYIYLKSRIKELINVGGKKVSPIEVEEHLIKIDGIVDCACVPMADPDGVLGEVVKAFIVTDREIDADAIRFCLATQLETYKLPAVFARIDEIPRTANGKIQRIMLQMK